ncbi:MAG: enoyl-CoA hydratase [Acidimicrobiales bacterium]
MHLDHVRYEVEDQVGVITLDRPEAANAQSPKVLAELDWAWQQADADRGVKVIVLKSEGKHFSAGHDLSSADGEVADLEMDFSTAEAHYDWETRHYLHYAKSWRDVPKPSIAAVQGKCIAAGLMLCWPCDLIIAADNAEFSDPVLFMGICGVELHAHTWELGPRKAKELLFTGSSVTAAEAEQLGMVNRVVPLDELIPTTMAMAKRIAQVDAFALRMAKRAVNHTLDVQGYSTAIDACFDMHHFGHTRARVVTGGMPALSGLSSMKDKGRQS